MIPDLWDASGGPYTLEKSHTPPRLVKVGSRWVTYRGHTDTIYSSYESMFSVRSGTVPIDTVSVLVQ